jgi:hypothetical protein
MVTNILKLTFLHTAFYPEITADWSLNSETSIFPIEKSSFLANEA